MAYRSIEDRIFVLFVSGDGNLHELEYSPPFPFSPITTSISFLLAISPLTYPLPSLLNAHPSFPIARPPSPHAALLSVTPCQRVLAEGEKGGKGGVAPKMKATKEWCLVNFKKKCES